MTPHREKELRAGWDKSELAKRIEATEMFAINHNFPQWTKETIPDYWLTIMKSEINKVLEGVESQVPMLYRNWLRRPKEDESTFEHILERYFNLRKQ